MMQPASDSSLRTYALMAKPVGAQCNMACGYCYYREAGSAAAMNDEVLESYVRQAIACHGLHATVEFVWHGGEPLLAGIDFFARAIEYQKQYAHGRRIINNMQTNATLIDETWARFFYEYAFVVGVSCDGPKACHDAYRKDKAGNATFDTVMHGVGLLKDAAVRADALCAVHAANVSQPAEVYGFLKEHFPLIHFLPVCEPTAQGLSVESVNEQIYGAFLCAVYDAWRQDDPQIRPAIAQFETIEHACKGKPAGVCEFEALCGHAASIEANGDVYSCDRFTDAQHLLGNLMCEPLSDLLEQNRDFGMDKTYGLAPECLSCEYVRICFGGCLKKRFMQAPSGRPINALCGAYRMLFSRVTG